MGLPGSSHARRLSCVGSAGKSNSEVPGGSGLDSSLDDAGRNPRVRRFLGFTNNPRRLSFEIVTPAPQWLGVLLHNIRKLGGGPMLN